MVGDEAVKGKLVITLGESDVDAIKNGDTSYCPKIVKLVDVNMIGTRYELTAVIDVLVFNDRTRSWWGEAIFSDPSYALRSARRVYGNSVEYRVGDVYSE